MVNQENFNGETFKRPLQNYIKQTLFTSDLMRTKVMQLSKDQRKSILVKNSLYKT